jgi:hypothetical protein
MTFLAGTAGVIDINGTVIVELITFVIMMAVLARYVYPEIVKVAEARQRAVAEQLHEAEKPGPQGEGRGRGQAHLRIGAQGNRGGA